MTDFKAGKCILLLDGSERGNERWHAKVELFEGMFKDMGMVDTRVMLNPENWKSVPSSKVEAWIINVWEAQFQRLSAEELKTIREAGSVQPSWDIQEFHTFEDLEKVEKPIRTASISKDFGI